jgi:hypothetical protein
MSVFAAVYTSIKTQLAAGTALVSALGGTYIYQRQAPKGKTLPYVVMSHAGGGPENINPSDMRDNLWFVRVYADDAAEANTIDGFISASLNKKALSVSGYTNIYTAREDEYELVENPVDKQPVYMAGANYRIRLDN